DERFLPQVAELARLFCAFGVRLLLAVDYAMPTYDGLPTADPLDERVQAWWKRRAALVYRYVPSLCGFLVKADSEHRPGPFTYGRDHAQGANLLARALQPFGGVVIWRCFVYDCKQNWRDTTIDRPKAAYEHYAHLDGQFDDNVILQIKHGPVDFQVCEPLSPLLLAMPRTHKALELQLAQEYTGQQIDLYAMRGMWDEVFADLPQGAISAIAAIANTGDSANWTGHPFAQFNLFEFGRTAWQRERDFAQEARLWATLSYGFSGTARETLVKLLLQSRPAYAKYHAPLGIGWMVAPHEHYSPSPMGYEYSPWGTYHRASREAIGIDRTAAGTGYLLQYPPELQRRYADPATCPDELLLFFHRLRYSFVMKDGRTLLERIFDDLAEGCERGEALSAMLDELSGTLPAPVFLCARERMTRQQANAREWRDVLTDFFQRLTLPAASAQDHRHASPAGDKDEKGVRDASAIAHLKLIGGQSMKTYPNLLRESGISQSDIDQRIEDVFRAIFLDEKERFYVEAGDEGYLVDTGNNDARTEGMSYGMMMAVQRDRKDIFDRLWRFSKRHMWQAQGLYAGYFAWSVQPSGAHNAEGPAPDGEEYYAMALFFAAHRWGEGEPPLDYATQARDILRHCLHQHELIAGGRPMWEPTNALIKFTPDLDFSDPSYHLPHFYELFARWADEADRPFWQRAAEASRAYLAQICHPETGLAPEYANYDGTPDARYAHPHFFSDAYRVAMNLGLDCAWNGSRAQWQTIANRLQRFLADQAEPLMTYTLDGHPIEPPALHPVAIVATTAASALATDAPLARAWIRRFWDTPVRIGTRRYYDNCLYFFSLLMLAGEYRIYE
ncbi:MAG: glycosyl hydrolase family 8, partial [Clostridia bacterium]